MIKNFIYIFLVLAITGCSVKKVEDRLPLWYTNPPKDYNFIYSTATSKTLQSAHNIAILSINKDLNSKIIESLTSSNTPLHLKDETDKQNIVKTSSLITKKLVFHGVRTLNSTLYHSQELILISVLREAVFEDEKSKLDTLYLPLKKEFKTLDAYTPLEQYVKIDQIKPKLYEIAVRAELLQIISNGYDASEYFAFFNSLRDRFLDIKKSLDIRVLGDYNSLPFVKPVEDGLRGSELEVTKDLKRANSYHIFLTAKIKKKMDYQFYKVTLTAKIIIATKDKKIISTKLHTFVGKSRKSYKDAQLQAESGFMKSIKYFGVFNFLGLIKQ